MEMPTLGLVETQNASQRVENLLGRLGRTTLLQAYVVIHADSGQVRHLFATQPNDSAAWIRRDAES